MKLVDDYQELSDEEKGFILAAWGRHYGQHPTLGMLPFLNEEALIKAIISFSTLRTTDIKHRLLARFGIKVDVIVHGPQSEEDKNSFGHAHIKKLVDGEWIRERIEL